jgi:methylglyoxal synthase
MHPTKRIALVTHDNRKQDLLEWAAFNRGLLARHALYATATTGRLLRQELGLDVVALHSGPLGGLKPMPHDPDVKALLRIAVVWNIPVACNRASADFMISSPLMAGEYHRVLPGTAGDAEVS